MQEQLSEQNYFDAQAQARTVRPRDPGRPWAASRQMQGGPDYSTATDDQRAEPGGCIAQLVEARAVCAGRRFRQVHGDESRPKRRRPLARTRRNGECKRRGELTWPRRARYARSFLGGLLPLWLRQQPVGRRDTARRHAITAARTAPDLYSRDAPDLLHLALGDRAHKLAAHLWDPTAQAFPLVALGLGRNWQARQLRMACWRGAPQDSSTPLAAARP